MSDMPHVSERCIVGDAMITAVDLDGRTVRLRFERDSDMKWWAQALTSGQPVNVVAVTADEAACIVAEARAGGKDEV